MVQLLFTYIVGPSMLVNLIPAQFFCLGKHRAKEDFHIIQKFGQGRLSVKCMQRAESGSHVLQDDFSSRNLSF